MSVECADWHLNILGKLGKTDLPNSYIKYLVDRITGSDISATLVDQVTLYSFLGALMLSLYFTIKDCVKSKKAGRPGDEETEGRRD